MLVFDEAQAFGSVPRASRARYAHVIARALFVTAMAMPGVAARAQDDGARTAASLDPAPFGAVVATDTAPSLPTPAGFASREEAIRARDAMRAWMASRPRPKRARASLGTPAFVDVSGPAPASPGRDAGGMAALTTDPERILAGHLLRRAGFGPSPKDLKKVLKVGRTKWIDLQLNPKKISDAQATALMGKPPADDEEEDHDWIARWYVRMAFTRRQLLEKMTLVWHEHFATSNEKVGVGFFMHDQEDLLRASALGSFRDLLVGVTRDQAMLVWLDNNYNSGSELEPPNETRASSSSSSRWERRSSTWTDLPSWTRGAGRSPPTPRPTCAPSRAPSRAGTRPGR